MPRHCADRQEATGGELCDRQRRNRRRINLPSPVAVAPAVERQF
jgi:hypothetical protein